MKKGEETAGWKVQEVIILIGKLTFFFFLKMKMKKRKPVRSLFSIFGLIKWRAPKDYQLVYIVCADKREPVNFESSIFRILNCYWLRSSFHFNSDE
jgi:hypothetical protein